MILKTQKWFCPVNFCQNVELFLTHFQCFPSLKKLQVPSLSKLPFKSIDQKFLEKSKTQLNAFLQVNNKPKSLP